MSFSNVIQRRQALVFTLRVLLGYPRHRPISNPTAFLAAGPIDAVLRRQLQRMASDLGQDLVVVHLDLETEEPTSLSLAIRRTDTVEIITGCEPYAASETAPLQLLGDGVAWRIGERHALTARKPPAAKRRPRGIAVARRRWLRAAEQLGSVRLEGGRLLERGASLEASVDTNEALAAAAA
ncbi:hypothetical protein [Stakelama marina]|uniref:Uncharacterized protein n=1 Tax=Stakelama marina TaxID=2826939 RepID=A0A8T4INE2_9SPHN|nr:hypothetical protein [Stakelama marina]MBR0553839.1 hypothetical protein [Stakelama marina]